MQIIRCPACKGEGYHETLGMCRRCYGTGHTVTMDVEPYDWSEETEYIEHDEDEPEYPYEDEA